MSILSPAQWREKAQAALQAQRIDEMRQILRKAIDEHPAEALLRNSAGNLFLRAGDIAESEAQFAQAMRLSPQSLEYRTNRAIALSSLGRNAEAIAVLAPVETAGASDAAYCSIRGTAERGAGNKAAAAQWYDRAIRLEPNRIKALHGRARTAIERGEPDALARVDLALAANQGDADLWLARAQALDVAGNPAGARDIAEQLVQQAPNWGEGLKFLAQLRLAAGESDFTSHYGTAMERVPQDPNIPVAWANILAGLDYNAEAAEVAARARSLFPQHELFTLLEAVYAGAAGDDDRAEDIFATLAIDTPDRWLHETRHRMRRHELERAEGLLDRLVDDDPQAIGPWALRGILWRLTDDPREGWLHQQDGLHALRPLHDAERILPAAIEKLHALHDNSPLPLGQSLRGGSQTRGLLFDRIEPEFAALHDAIFSTLEEHRSKMPPADPAHPILRHRDTPWRITGSWSVRLSGGGDYHTSHIHPQGVVSSALYCLLPKDRGDDPQAGWLELGRPPPDLRLDLEPIRTIEPQEAHLALFPSTLYHGTRPFAGDRRMTVAFDVSLVQSQLHGEATNA